MYRPMWFLAENVGGLRSANEGKAFEKIMSDIGAPDMGHIFASDFL